MIAAPDLLSRDDRILDLWASGMCGSKIQLLLDIDREVIDRCISRARRAGDPRAVRRGRTRGRRRRQHTVEPEPDPEPVKRSLPDRRYRVNWEERT